MASRFSLTFLAFLLACSDAPDTERGSDAGSNLDGPVRVIRTDAGTARDGGPRATPRADAAAPAPDDDEEQPDAGAATDAAPTPPTPPTPGPQSDASSAPAAAVPDASAPPVVPATPPKDAGPAPSAPLDAGTAPVKPVLDAAPPVQVPDAAVEPVEPSGPPPDAGAPVVDAGGLDATCKPGRYTGTFEGQLAVAFGPMIPVTGTLTLPLAASADGLSLQIQDGVVEASDAVGTPVRGRVTGTVDCQSGTLEDGRLEGSYGAEGSPQALGFSGEVSGRYTTEPPALAGGFRAGASGASATATGSYSTTLEP